MFSEYICLAFIFSCFEISFGIIYQLNDTEHEQLPQIFDLERYDTCMQDPAAIYCVASLELYGEPDHRIYNLIKEYSQHKIKHYNYSKIDRGVCVTKSCVKYMKKNGAFNIDDNLEMVLEECLNDQISNRYNVSTRLYGWSCDRHTEVDEKYILDYIVATVVIFLCAAVVVGSWYDNIFRVNGDEKIEKGVQFLQCFSIYRNIKGFTLDGGKRLSDLQGFHGIRTIGELVVIYGHSFLLFVLFIGDTHMHEKLYESQWYRIIFSISSIVQIFFIMSGFLLTYLLEIYAENNQVNWKSVPKIIFQRWWRLTPSATLVLTITATWSRYFGSGPLWKYFVTNGASKHCKQYFWAHVFFLNNFFKDDKCSYQSWHIAADMQLFIPCLIVHFAIRNRSLNFKMRILSFLLLIGIVCPIAHVWWQDLDSLFLITPEAFRAIGDDTFNKYHVLPHNNIAGFVIGMAIGYIAYDLKQKKLELPHFKIGSILCWLAIPMYLGVFYITSLFISDTERSPLIFRIIYASCYRVVIGLIGSVWILGIILKFNGITLDSKLQWNAHLTYLAGRLSSAAYAVRKVRQLTDVDTARIVYFSYFHSIMSYGILLWGCSKALMEWHWWVVPSKLSFGVYLVHSEVINYLLGSRTRVHHLSLKDFNFIYLGVVVVSNALALVLYLLVEAPSYQLIKVFVGEKTSTKKAKKEI